jgi:signal transduction histidine kinase
VIVKQDVSERVRLEHLKSDFVAMVSHELRTPLTSIKGFVSVLLNDARLKHEDHRSFIEIIDHECDRLRRMVADLLCITRIDSGRALEVQWQQIDLSETVERVVEAQRIYAPEHILLCEVPPQQTRVEADQDKIVQVLTNLVNNAIKYSPVGTTVSVSAGSDDGTAWIKVADQGFGIDPQDIPYLFQQYSRLREATERRIRGTGLGLYLTKHLVEAHGGQITVESELGQGSTFTVAWPARRAWEDV